MRSFVGRGSSASCPLARRHSDRQPSWSSRSGTIRRIARLAGAGNHAAVAFDIDDLDALNAVLSSVPPEMAAQAESHGVIVSTMTAYVQA